MAQLEPWQKVWIDADSTFAEVDNRHARIGCVTCHGGTEPVISASETTADLFVAMMEAHQAEIHYDGEGNALLEEVKDHSLTKDPSIQADQSCGGASCHAEIVHLNENSMHTQLWGEKHKVALRAGFSSFSSCPQSLQDSYNQECTACHTTCGQCHISRPNSVHGGFLDSHKFQKTPEMENNCTACHGSRVGNDYSGHLEGNVPDIHSELGHDCFFCHKEDLHGDGRTDYTSRYLVDGIPQCRDCHSLTEDDNMYHTAHWPGGTSEDHTGSGLSCFVCHSQPYTSCINCHTAGVWSSDSPQGYAEFPSFRIGHNSGNWSTHEQEDEKYVLVRHVPVSEDSYQPWSWPQLDSWSEFETWEYASPHNVIRITPQTAIAADGPASEWTCWINCHPAPGFDMNKKLFLYESFVDSLAEFVTNPTQEERTANRRVIVNDYLPTWWLND